MARTYETLTQEEKDILQELFVKYRDLNFVADGPLGNETLKEIAKEAEQRFLEEAERLLGKDVSFQDFRKYFFTMED